MLKVATVALFLSCLLRGVLDFVSKFFEKEINSHVTLYNSIMLIFGDLVPICLQLSTLVFGYIRRKNNRNNRLEV